MTFHDITLMGGTVQSRRIFDTRELVPAAVEIAAELLAKLRSGAEAAENPVPGLPSFSVRLGLPREFPQAPGNHLFFCVGAPGKPPFQYNVLLRADADPEAAVWAVTTLLGITLLGDVAGWTPQRLMETAGPLAEERPALLATVVPALGATPQRIKIAADFATCFGAALLLEPDKEN